MFLVRNINIFISLLLVIDCVFCTESGTEENNDKQKEDTAEPSSKDDSEESEEEGETTPPTEKEKLKEEIPEVEEEESQKFGVPTNSSGKVTLFDQFESEAAGNEDEEEEVEPESPEEMKKLKEETFKQIVEFNERQGLSEVSQEQFDQDWKQKEESYGKGFPGKIRKFIAFLKAAEKKEHATSPKEVESVTEEASTEVPEMEINPAEVFSVKSAKGKVCILAKFYSAITITITYSGESAEQKVEVTVPSSGNVKGKCGGPNKSPMLQISWEKFIFTLVFNKTSEDNWSATLVELTYDTSEPLFDGAVDRPSFPLSFGQLIQLCERW